MAGPANQESVRAFRWLMGTMALVVGVIGLLRHVGPRDFIDPLWVRGVVVALFLVGLLASFWSTTSRRHVASIFGVLCCVLTTWTGWLVWLNHMEPSLVTTFNLAVLVVGLAMGLQEISTLAVGAFLLYSVAVGIAITSLVEDPVTDPPVFLVGLIGSAIGALVVVSRYGRSRRMQAEAERQWRSVVSGHPDAILVHTDGIVVYGNQHAHRLFARDAEPLQGREIAELHPALTKALGEEVDRSFALTTSKQQIRHFGVSSSDVWFEGRSATQLNLHDRTEQAEREGLLEKAREEAEEAARAKAGFLAVVSHEIRTPLNGIIGLTDVLAEEDLAPKSRECLELIRSSGDSLLMIINDILDFSKAEGGHLELEKLPFSLREAIRHSWDIMEPRARQKGIELSLNVDADVPEQLIGDPLRVRQILLNLVSNAIKFTSKGFVRGYARTQPDGGVCIEVADSGTGIPADRVQKLFEPFSQVDASTTRRFGGTGLGLSICKQLTDLMGGRIWVESTLGVGSVFRVELPLPAVTTVSAPRDVEALRSPGVALRVLLAEDNLVNQKVATAMLSKLGHRVAVAGSGVEVLQMVDEATYDVILMDMMMPEMGGVEAAEAVRARTNIPQPYIVALTANAMSEDRERCLAAGMDDFLTKPLRRADLVGALAKFESRVAVQ